MEENQGWIKLHRKFLKWEWYDDINTSRFFLHCLFRANHKDKKWRGTMIKRGQYGADISETISIFDWEPTPLKKTLDDMTFSLKTILN